MRLRLLLLAAASPLCMTAAQAHAETVISTAVTTPLATATAANGGPDDLSVAAAGSVKPTSGTAVTLNSNNRLTVEGAVAIQNADNATAVLIQGGRIKMRSPPKVLTGNFRPSQLSFFLS